VSRNKTVWGVVPRLKICGLYVCRLSGTTGLIKIGTSIDILQRLVRLVTATSVSYDLLHIVECDKERKDDLETRAHALMRRRGFVTPLGLTGWFLAGKTIALDAIIDADARGRIVTIRRDVALHFRYEREAECYGGTIFCEPRS